MIPASASVIVRAKNEVETIERTLRSVRAQGVPAELIVVDSGSTDGTLAIARRHADRLIEIPPESFSYGAALNIGAREASAPFHFALSAHCFAEQTDWIERSLAHYQREDVAGVAGAPHLPDGTLLQRPFASDLADYRAHPHWGFSNHASSWRASVWERFPFNEQLESAEDKEWLKRVIEAGYVIIYDPAVWIDGSHWWRGGARDYFERERKAAEAFELFEPLEAYGLRDLVRDWWSSLPDDGHSSLFHRLNYRRFAGLSGRYVGQRRGRRAAERARAD